MKAAKARAKSIPAAARLSRSLISRTEYAGSCSPKYRYRRRKAWGFMMTDLAWICDLSLVGDGCPRLTGLNGIPVCGCALGHRRTDACRLGAEAPCSSRRSGGKIFGLTIRYGCVDAVIPDTGQDVSVRRVLARSCRSVSSVFASAFRWSGRYRWFRLNGGELYEGFSSHICTGIGLVRR